MGLLFLKGNIAIFIDISAIGFYIPLTRRYRKGENKIYPISTQNICGFIAREDHSPTLSYQRLYMSPIAVIPNSNSHIW